MCYRLRHGTGIVHLRVIGGTGMGTNLPLQNQYLPNVRVPKPSSGSSYPGPTQVLEHQSFVRVLNFGNR